MVLCYIKHLDDHNSVVLTRTDGETQRNCVCFDADPNLNVDLTRDNISYDLINKCRRYFSYERRTAELLIIVTGEYIHHLRFWISLY